ncbi:MAG: D-alanyl-D-alanine carboxypeptidase family protein [Betaproteobacteria bacterium]|nr:D-alanyl-D-alanine carboxypeptidase family protein [Betaproteobacteria bacterium]
MEPRSIGAGHTVVFQFDGAITTPGVVTAVDSTGAPVSLNVPALLPGNEILVTLPNVADNRRVTISLAGINGVSNAHASMGFLLGDVNNSRAVDATDLAAVKAYSRQASGCDQLPNDLENNRQHQCRRHRSYQGASGRRWRLESFTCLLLFASSLYGESLMQSGPESNIEALGISRASLSARGLCEHEEAGTLVLAEIGADGREYLLVPAAAAWRDLKAAAGNDGSTIFLASAFRSVARQSEIIREKLDAGMGIGEILTVCAPPGFSEHHTGRAVDIVCPDMPDLEIEFEETEAFQWLVRHARRFGFTLSIRAAMRTAINTNPWHWCFRRAESACPRSLSPAGRGGNADQQRSGVYTFVSKFEAKENFHDAHSVPFSAERAALAWTVPHALRRRRVGECSVGGPRRGRINEWFPQLGRARHSHLDQPRAQRSAIRDERLHRRQLRGESLLHGDGAAELQPGTESRGAFPFGRDVASGVLCARFNLYHCQRHQFKISG